MAGEFDDVKQAAEVLRNALQGLDEATKQSTVGMVAFQRELKTVPGQFARGMGNFAKSVGQGETSFKSLNTVVDMASNAMAGLAKTIPYAGEGLAAGIKATAEASKFMLEQMDASTKAFNDLSRVGALTASGMSGLQKQFTTSGLQLNTFVKQINENSVALARFRGLTGDGAEDFSRITGELTRGTDDSLRRMGLNAEDIGSAVGAFVTQQTRLGRSQVMTNAELTEGSKRYAQELDLLSKVTGMSREAIQKQQDAALSESRFRANYEDLMAQGKVKEAQALMTLQTRMNTFGATMGQGTRDLISGVADTEAAVVMMNRTGGAAMDIINRLKSGQIDQDQAQRELQAAMERNRSAITQTSKFVQASNSAYGESAEVYDFLNTDMSKSFEKAKKTQDAQTAGADDLTNSTVKAQKNMEGLNIEIQKLGFTFLPAASSAVESMTKAMEKFVKYVNKTIGAGLDEGEGIGRAVPGAVGTMESMDGTGGVGPGAGAPPATAGTTAEVQAARKSVASRQVAEQGVKGLKLKSAEAVAGGESTTPLMELAYMIQNALGGDLKYFSGLNDTGRDPNSKHKAGRALDVVLNDPGKYESTLGMIKQMPGVSFAQYEQKGQVNPNGSIATGDHIHAEVSAARGAILSGPIGGYKPNLTMHGTEAIIPLNKTPSAVSSNNIGGMDPALMMAQLEKMDEMVSVLKSQLGVSEKLLRYQS